MLVNSQLNILKYFEDVQKKKSPKHSRPIFNEMFFKMFFHEIHTLALKKTLQSRCSCVGPGCSSRISCWTWRTHAMFRRDKKKIALWWSHIMFDEIGDMSHEMKYFVHGYVINIDVVEMYLFIYRCMCLFQRKDVHCCNCKQWQDSSTLNESSWVSISTNRDPRCWRKHRHETPAFLKTNIN